MSLPAGTRLTVVKERLNGSEAARYPADVLAGAPGWVVARAPWGRARLDLGYLVFEPDDCFVEYFALDQPVNAFALYDRDRHLKGWYCNVAENRLEGDTLRWRDLLLDLIVYPDGRQLVLDEDELAATGLADRDPVTHHAILRALAWLRAAAAGDEYPFSEADREGGG